MYFQLNSSSLLLIYLTEISTNLSKDESVHHYSYALTALGTEQWQCLKMKLNSTLHRKLDLLRLDLSGTEFTSVDAFT